MSESEFGAQGLLAGGDTGGALAAGGVAGNAWIGCAAGGGGAPRKNRIGGGGKLGCPGLMAGCCDAAAVI